MMDAPPVQFKFAAMGLARPPRITLHFDVALYNAHVQPRWFLLPDKFMSGQPPDYSVFKNSIYRLGPDRGVIVGHFQGTRGFYALYVPGGGALSLDRLPVAMIGDYAAVVPLEAVIASAFTVGGEPAHAWFEGSPLSHASGRISAKSLAAESGVTFARKTADGREVPVMVAVEERLTLEVSTAGK